MHTLLTELNKYIGPKSPNPDKLLIVDGEPQTLNAESGPLIDYFVVQAYTVSGGSPRPTPRVMRQTRTAVCRDV